MFSLKKYTENLKKSNFASKLLKNAAVSFAGEGGAAVVTFITTIVLIRLIGNTAYGILAVAYSFIMIVDNIVNFQSWHAMITFGSQAVEKKDYSYLQAIIKIGSIIDFITAFLGMTISLATAQFFSNILSWNAETTTIIYIMAFMILFNFTGTSIGIIRLFDKFKYYSIYRIVTEILRFAMVLIFCCIMKKGLYGASLAYCLGYILGYILLFCFFIHTINITPNISVKGIIKANTKGRWKKIFTFTCWTSLSSSADIPVQQMDVIFLSMISYDVVAVFKVYKQIGQALTKLTTPIKQAVMPLFSELIAKGKMKESYDYLIKMRNKSLQILMPAVVLMTGGSLLFMHFTLDDIYVRYWYILFIYLFLRALALSYASIHPLFVALGQVKQNFIVTLFANVVYIVLVWVTVGRIGIWAILLGLAVEYFVIIHMKRKRIEKVVQR